MTSCGVCPSCQGEVRLYEEHWTDYGREWIKFSGKCWNCGCHVTEYPQGFDEAYEQAKKEEKQREFQKMLETMTEQELYEKLGSYDYPYYVGRAASTVFKETARAITLEDCIAKTIPLSLKALRSDIIIKRFGKETRITSEQLKKEGWFNFEVDVHWTVRRGYSDDYDYYHEVYGCRSIEEVEQRIRQHHSDEWKVYIVGKYEVASKRYGDSMKPEVLHKLLEVIA